MSWPKSLLTIKTNAIDFENCLQVMQESRQSIATKMFLL